ncbi:MAG: hypothetical protein LBK76_04340 [Verrucomicrobiales bacterium]|nr:hypothetical protein [Verrucomicrobiales bacterium]
MTRSFRLQEHPAYWQQFFADPKHQGLSLSVLAKLSGHSQRLLQIHAKIHGHQFAEKTWIIEAQRQGWQYSAEFHRQHQISKKKFAYWAKKHGVLPRLSGSRGRLGFGKKYWDQFFANRKHHHLTVSALVRLTGHASVTLRNQAARRDYRFPSCSTPAWVAAAAKLGWQNSKAFCLAHGVNTSTYYDWARRTGAQASQKKRRQNYWIKLFATHRHLHLAALSRLSGHERPTLRAHAARVGHRFPVVKPGRQPAGP